MGLQSVSVIHAANYGDEPHEHDGMVCAISIVQTDDIAILPPSQPLTFEPDEQLDTYECTYVSEPRLTPQGRAPPPRAPPAYIQ